LSSSLSLPLSLPLPLTVSTASTPLPLPLPLTARADFEGFEEFERQYKALYGGMEDQGVDETSILGPAKVLTLEKKKYI
jgi:hypothetical protein